jgi:uncharacterized protein
VAPSSATGPSFACDDVKSEVLKLICDTPELAKADRDLAERYGLALARTHDPAKARAEELGFIATRNASPPDAIVLLRLYQARQEALASD